MKQKYYVWGFVVLLFIAVGTIIFLFDKKVQIVAASTVFIEQQWQVQVSEPLKDDSITSGSVYVTRASGEKIAVPLELSDDKAMLTVQGLKTGEYRLHITDKAFKSKGLRSKAYSVDFKVVEKLEAITSEKELREYFEVVLERQKVEQNQVKWSLGVSEESAVMTDSAASDKSARHSDTNNQVEGIEEGDIMVTDGRYIYTLRDQQLVMLDVQNKGKAVVANTITFENQIYPTQLMLHENYLLVTYDEYVEEQTKQGYYNGKSYVKTAIYDVTDVKAPKLIREIGQEGYKLGMRKSGSILYTITSQSPNYYLLEEGQDVELRPTIYDSNKEDELSILPIDRIAILPDSYEPSYMVISAIDLADLQQGELVTESFLGSSSAMYMSEQAIYVTAAQYERSAMNPAASSRMMMDIAWGGLVANTQFYKFALEGTEVELVGTASAPGTVLNQFSMDEYDGHFRVAMTKYESNDRDSSTNSLHIFDSLMNEVSSLTDLARGERIYSARFMGDKAYIVTFKNVDPLFVIDVANPTQPKVLGELKIPGFSNYLHPIDDTHLLGIGYDTVVKTDEYSKEPFIQTNGMKVALFDVSDLANPKEQDSVIIGGRGTYSDVQGEHRALFRDVENNLYGFPINLYEEKGEYDSEFLGSGALIYKVTVEGGIELAADLVNYDVEGLQYEDWERIVQRILYVDDVLYTVARHELKSYQYPSFKPIQEFSY